MSCQAANIDPGICPITLARKLALVRIDRESNDNGVTEVFNGVLDDLKAAITERNSHEEAVDIVNHYAGRLERRGKWKEMQQLYRRAINDLGVSFGLHHPATLDTTLQLGRLLRRIRQSDDAQKLYAQSLEGMDSRCLYQLYFANEIGVAYADQFLLREAEREFRKALHGFSKIWGCNHIWTCTAAMNLSDVFRTQGRLRDAAIMLRLGLLGVAKSHEAAHSIVIYKAPRFIKIYQQYMEQGTWNDARGVCELALVTFEEIFGDRHKETLHVVWDLAHILKEQGQHRESRKLMKRAIEGLKS